MRTSQIKPEANVFIQRVKNYRQKHQTNRFFPFLDPPNHNVAEPAQYKQRKKKLLLFFKFQIMDQIW